MTIFGSDTVGISVSNKATKLYNNQFFDYLSEQLPKNHQDMFKWCEVVYNNSPKETDCACGRLPSELYAFHVPKGSVVIDFVLDAE